MEKPSARLAALGSARRVAPAELAPFVARLIEHGAGARAGPLLPELHDADEQFALAAAAALSAGRRVMGERRLASLLAQNPGHVRARALALRQVRRFGAPPLASALAAGTASEVERAVVAARAAADAQDWPALRGLEPALAAVGANDPFYPDAALLRAAWRASTRDTGEQALARTLITGLLTTRRGETEARILLAELERESPVRRAVPLLRIAGDRATPPLTPREAEQIAALARTLPSEGEELVGARARILAFLDRAPRVPRR